jgi:hypothetical protein
MECLVRHYVTIISYEGQARRVSGRVHGVTEADA